MTGPLITLCTLLIFKATVVGVKYLLLVEQVTSAASRLQNSVFITAMRTSIASSAESGRLERPECRPFIGIKHRRDITWRRDGCVPAYTRTITPSREFGFARQVSCGVASIPKSPEFTLAPQNSTRTLNQQKADEVASREEWVWTKHWYPVAVAADLDPTKPWATKLLGSSGFEGFGLATGRDLVLWKDGTGAWRAFEDLCPHRLAPLSQGRVDPTDGSLQCSYHGWKFDGAGKALSIPQAQVDGQAVEASARASKRSCVNAYPIKEELGYLWVWPESGALADLESSQKETAVNELVRKLEPGDVTLMTNLNFVRDFPVSYDVMVENISDQSHVPFAHHGVAGNRKSPWSSHFVISNVNKRLAGKDGYTYDLEWSPDFINPPIKQEVTMTPPTYIEYFTPKETGFTALWFHVIPLDENNTRVINHALSTAPLPKVVQWLAGARPRWLDHLLLNEIFDGDMAYLTEADTNAKKHDTLGRKWAKDYYLPAQADRSVIAWRKWFHGRGRDGYVKASGGAPTNPPYVPAALKFDRYNQHTKNCPACSKALNNLRSIQTFLKVAGVGALLFEASMLGEGGSFVSAASLGFLAASSGLFWLSSVMHSFEAKFIGQEYDHSKH